MRSEPAPPSGTVTFLFTDIEGSTRFWEEHPDEMRRALELHDATIRRMIAAGGGYVFSTAGDSFAAAFDRASSALATACEAQAELGRLEWPGGTPLRVRMGVHTGEAQERGGDYFGPVLNRAARVMSAAHGGQVVTTATTARLIDAEVAGDLHDLGEHRLPDVVEPLHLFQVGGERGFPPLRSLGGFDSALPAQRDALIGRAADVDRVRRLLLGSRLVTLTGVGGTGKTRLAIEVATEEQPHQDGGVFFVDLARIADSSAVMVTLLADLGSPARSDVDELDVLGRFFGSRASLVVVDNCEHVLDGAAEVIDALLDRCPGVRVLATSRELLDLPGEATFAVQPLAVTDGSGVAPAVRLFVERAVAADDSLAIDAKFRGVAQKICAAVDGIPLAIEFAAARLRSMGVAELAGRLDDRFTVLSGRRRGVEHRQQTLRATLDWSHDLLSDVERLVFRRLASFAGDFSLGAVAPIVDIAPDEADELIDALVAKSLVVAVRAPAGALRYRLLETVKQYAVERLDAAGELEECAHRHCAYYVDLVRSAPSVMGDLTVGNNAVLRPESAEITRAIEWATEGGDHAAAAVLLGLGMPMNASNVREWNAPTLSALDEHLDAAHLPPEERGAILLTTAQLSFVAGRVPEGISAADRAVACVGDPPPQWAVFARCTRMIVQLVLQPAEGLRELQRIEDQLVPRVASPEAGAFVVAESRKIALIRLRRYAEAAEVCATALHTAPYAAERIGHLHWSMQSAAMLAGHLAGRPDLAAAFVPFRYYDPKYTWMYPFYSQLGECLHLADTVGLDAARAALVRAARNDERTRVAGGDSVYLAGFARLSQLDGEHERAHEYLRHTAAMLPEVSALATETLAAIEDWSDDEFPDRSTAEIVASFGDDRRRLAEESALLLLHAEMERWSHLVDER